MQLQDFVSEPHNYTPTRPRGQGYFLFGWITWRAREQILERTGRHWVCRMATPVTDREPSRSGRYHITDPNLRFYFRFLGSRQEQLALGIQEQALAEISRHMIDLVATYTWEELCREWTLRAGAAGELPYLSVTVGSAWTAETQVDVVGFNSMEKTLILGECKWSRTPNDRKPLAELIEKKNGKDHPLAGKLEGVLRRFFPRQLEVRSAYLPGSDQPAVTRWSEMEDKRDAPRGNLPFGSGFTKVDSLKQFELQAGTN